MKENDPLDSVLKEWKAPEPSPAMDAGVQAAFRARHQPSFFRRFWSLRISIPVPALAMLLLLVGTALFVLRRNAPQVAPPPPTTISSPDTGYLTRVETAGFQPLPDGAVRIIRSKEPQKGN